MAFMTNHPQMDNKLWGPLDNPWTHKNPTRYQSLENAVCAWYLFLFLFLFGKDESL